MIIIFLNIFIISTYIYNFDLPFNSLLLKILFFILIILFSSLIIYRKKKDLITKLNLSFFSIIFSLIIIEIFFYFKPGLLPNSISIWLGDRDQNSKIKITQTLKESPFIKFKANTKIKINYYRGSPDEFNYEWITDKNGFKNSPKIADLNKYKIVVIGDSIVEGFGVSEEDTITSILTKKSYPSYSLGVQGYSVSQSKGALEQFGIDLNPEIILCIYVRGNSNREKFFINNDLKKKKQFTGGIDNQFRVDQNFQIRTQGKYVFSALWLYSTFVRNNFKNLLKSPNFKNAFFNRYSEVSLSAKVRELNVEDMQLLTKNFIDIAKISKQNNSKFIIGFLEHRDLNYYKKATGLEPHPSQFSEREFIRNFSNKNKIPFIDFGAEIRNYVNTLPKEFKFSDLPYLKVDGHLSRVGNEIIAENLIEFIN